MELKWISVHKRLPEKTTWCLVCADGAINCMAFVPGIGWEDWTNPTNPNIVVESITHWAVPEPPTKSYNETMKKTTVDLEAAFGGTADNKVM